MKKLPILFLSIFIISCNTNIKKDNSETTWTPLWNGQDFANWHTYLGTQFNVKVDSIGNIVEPYGLDNDPLQVISVSKVDEENAIRITGEAWGMIFTEQEYSNYHLKLKVKWGEKMYRPRENGPRDSGLLYHGFGEPGSADNWMGSQELQIQQGDMGDYWPVGDVEIDIPSISYKDNYYIYDEGADLRTYYLAEILKTATEDSLAKRRVFKALDAEKPYGEWNDIELIVMGDSSIHIVNGQVVMRLFNSRIGSSQKHLNSGRIILQSEGAEVYYKDIYIRQIAEIPEKFKQPI
jgi:hypothetical protein